MALKKVLPTPPLPLVMATVRASLGGELGAEVAGAVMSSIIPVFSA